MSAPQPDPHTDYEMDYFVKFTCGCLVVFDYASGYRTSRMEACDQHGGRDQTDERTQIVNMAREDRDTNMRKRRESN